MYKESNIRSIAKGFSWRVIATTITIVCFFFERLDLAIVVGMIETVVKVRVYLMYYMMFKKYHKHGVLMLRHFFDCSVFT
jgi:adenylylsulfate kinase